MKSTVLRLALALAARPSPAARLTGGSPTTTAVRRRRRRRRRRHGRPGHPRARSRCPKKLLRDFEEESGYHLEVRAAGDAGALTTKLVLTADNPTGDVAFGVDNTFASRALDEGVFAEYDAELPAGADEYALEGDGADRLAPVDVGDVCVNVDDTWFADHDLAPPATLEDLTDPAYTDLFVTPSALTSSPGLAFLLAHDRGVRRRLARLLGAAARQRRARRRRLGRRLLRRVHPGRRATAPARSCCPTTPRRRSPCRRARTSPRPAPCSTPASARSSTPACSPAPRTPRAAEALRRLPARPTRCRPRCRPACTSSRSPTASSCPPTGRGTPSSPTSPYEVDPAEIAANRDAWLEEWRDLATQ